MWFTKDQFKTCNELRLHGLAPRFEAGDVVARGFADLGYEEFQVLPGGRLLSLTAGTVSPLPSEHRQHFLWIPSVDECVELLERAGVVGCTCERVDRRTWRVVGAMERARFECERHSLHQALLDVLLEVTKSKG